MLYLCESNMNIFGKQLVVMKCAGGNIYGFEEATRAGGREESQASR